MTTAISATDLPPETLVRCACCYWRSTLGHCVLKPNDVARCPECGCPVERVAVPVPPLEGKP